METTNKRVKRVFNNISEVAHVWAYQQQSDAKCRNAYFEGDTIYSYGRHFPIARIYNKDGNKTVFFTTRTYGSTTSKHVNDVYMACRHMNILYMHNVVSYARFGELDYDHKINIGDFLGNISEFLRKVEKGRTSKSTYLRDARHYTRQLEAYLRFFRLEEVVGTEVKEKIADALSDKWNIHILEFEEKEAKRLADPKVQEKREKAQKARDAKIQEEDEEQLTKWRNFQTYSATISRKWSSRRGYGYSSLSYLRYNANKERIETSQHVEVPVEIAHLFYRHIQVMLRKGGCNSAQCCDYKLLNTYTVTEITQDRIVVGCHRIPMSEVELIAKQLKWI